jgi:hypothetical protein
MLSVCHVGVSMGRGSLSNKVRCTHERCQGVGPCCSQTCITREDQCTPDAARSSSTHVQPAARVSGRTQINTKLDNAPQTRGRCQGRRWRARQSPTYPKKRLVRNVVLERHHARGDSERTCRQPRSMSYTIITRIDVSDSDSRALGQRQNSRHRRGCEFLIPAWPQTALGLRVTATAHATQPCCAAFFERVQVKACELKRPCRRAGPAGIARPDVLVQGDKGDEAKLGE